MWTAALLSYLVATLPLLAAGALQAPRAALAFGPLHLALLAWTWLVRGGRTGRLAPLGDWTFPAALPFLYAELPLLMEGLPGPVAFHDGAVAHLEEALFRARPAFEWAAALPVTWMSELLHAGYFSYYALIVVPPALLWLALSGPRDPERRGDAFHRTVLALSLSMLPAFAFMVAWPVQGPRYFGPPAGVPDGPVRALVLTVLEAGSSRGAAFPSSHVSLAVAQSVLAVRFQPRVGAVVTALTLLLALGAVYGGFHYLVDVVAGAVLGVLAAAVALVARGRAGAPHPPDPGCETPSSERG